MPSKKSALRKKENVDIEEKGARVLEERFNVHIRAAALHLATYQKALGANNKDAGYYLDRANLHLCHASSVCADLPETLRKQYLARVSELRSEYQEKLASHNHADSLRRQ